MTLIPGQLLQLNGLYGIILKVDERHVVVYWHKDSQKIFKYNKTKTMLTFFTSSVVIEI